MPISFYTAKNPKGKLNLRSGEPATGTGLLTSDNPKPWLWGRIAGDLLDVATVTGTANTRFPGRLGCLVRGRSSASVYSISTRPCRRSRSDWRRRADRSLAAAITAIEAASLATNAMRGAAASRRHEMATGQQPGVRAAG